MRMVGGKLPTCKLVLEQVECALQRNAKAFVVEDMWWLVGRGNSTAPMTRAPKGAARPFGESKWKKTANPKILCWSHRSAGETTA